MILPLRPDGPHAPEPDELERARLRRQRRARARHAHAVLGARTIEHERLERAVARARREHAIAQLLARDSAVRLDADAPPSPPIADPTDTDETRATTTGMLIA